jgi:hypothetical protein
MIAAASAVFDPDVEEVLLRVYGVDPQEASLRRVWVLTQRLPPGTWHKGEGPGSWTSEAWLLAGVLDALNQLTWVQVQKSTKKRIPQPKPTWRPGKQATGKVSWTAFGESLLGMDGVSDGRS